jgi:hypothetical protein
MARRTPPTVARTAKTIREFCEAYNVSRATYYLWRKRGVGPHVLQPGGRRGRVIIPLESEIAWRERHTAIATATAITTAE